jgi:hypothetical protein
MKMKKKTAAAVTAALTILLIITLQPTARASQPIMIMAVDITIQQPMVGECQDLEWINAYNDTTAYVIDVNWSMDGNWISGFSLGGVYQAEVWLTAKDGYEFREDVLVRVNGMIIENIVVRPDQVEVLDHIMFAPAQQGSYPSPRPAVPPKLINPDDPPTEPGESGPLDMTDVVMAIEEQTSMMKLGFGVVAGAVIGLAFVTRWKPGE